LAQTEFRWGLWHISAVDTSLTHDLSPIGRDNGRVRVSQDELQRVVRLWQLQANKENANPIRVFIPARSSARDWRGRSVESFVYEIVYRNSLLSLKRSKEGKENQ
jgi:hypothetical protein